MKIRDLEMVRYKLTEPIEIDTNGKEVYIHTLVGCGSFIDSSCEELDVVERRSVFNKPSPGFYLAGEGTIELRPSPTWDVVVASCPAYAPVSFGVEVNPKHHEIGSGTHKRDVYEILGKDSDSQRLRFGETVNRRGGWSSWPPHSFDHKPELAPQFEEIFLYFTDPKDGYGIQMQDGEATVVTTAEMREIKLGKHELVGGPGTKSMYVWAYLSPEDKEYATWAEDLGQYL